MSSPPSTEIPAPARELIGALTADPTAPAKVEHHVARLRRRLGAESRSEMLSMLRTMPAPQGGDVDLGQPTSWWSPARCHYEQADTPSYWSVT